ncbi:hypothetical protein PCANC_18991 [Puccinia coronata f. sp. avenae]|uniref:Uncharacterized protein n=1 Tax=Puccinia coronata f. sp. avenae TaxID=200324 RepID=A0A2N5U3E7_9BASI|nr:hypothetical protein PCANC_18991 [Puccinia coronata f. sp. avenae]
MPTRSNTAPENLIPLTNPKAIIRQANAQHRLAASPPSVMSPPSPAQPIAPLPLIPLRPIHMEGQQTPPTNNSTTEPTGSASLGTTQQNEHVDGNSSYRDWF